MWCSTGFTFTLCTPPFNSGINSNNWSHYLRAENTQIYISLSTPSANCSIQQFSNDLDDIFAGRLRVD